MGGSKPHKGVSLQDSPGSPVDLYGRQGPWWRCRAASVELGACSGYILIIPQSSNETWKFWCFGVVMCVSTEATQSEFESQLYLLLAV